MFFNEDRPHFFNPLSGKYREVVVQCLRLLYRRLYTDLRDYGHSLNRDQLVDILLEEGRPRRSVSRTRERRIAEAGKRRQVSTFRRRLERNELALAAICRRIM